jgi:peroxiredoxin
VEGDGVADELKKLLEEKNKALEPVKKDKKKSAPIKGEISTIQKALELMAGYRHQRTGDHVAALASFKKGRADKSVLIRAHLAVGEHDQAVKLAAENVKSKPGVAWAYAEQVYVLHVAGQKDKAAHAMRMLRSIGAQADLDVPVFARVAPAAKAINLSGDWRRARPGPKDIRKRPELDSLGPFRWKPTAAPDWKLPDHKGGTVSLADYKGRPVIVVFYLGFGCLHCVEQLNAVAPMMKQFKNAGIDIVAVSTDRLNGLSDSVKAYTEDGAFPFPIVSDVDLKVFKEYRAYDDFEKMALHGTYLIDGDGLVRWQDISYEPFMETKFLLEEAKRLLASSTVNRTASAK